MTFYVRMQDKFLSGWGGAAGRRAMFIVECDTLLQACAIERAAQDRGEMKYISVATTPPRLRSSDQVTRREFKDLSGPWKSHYHAEDLR